MNIVYSLIKNNPEKLLKFYYSRKYKEDRDVVIDRLIELNAIDELFEIKDDSPSVIYPFLIDKLKNNKDKLILLYQTENNDYKLKIIHHLINCNAVNELWEIKDTSKNNIYPYLIEIYKDDEENLFELYQIAKNEFKEEIISNLIELSATEKLWIIRNYSTNQIYPYLIEVYKNNEERLIELYQDAKNEYKNNIIDYLKKIEAIGSLRSIKNDYPNEIYPYLIESYQNNEARLIELYQDAKNEYKNNIIDYLKKIEAIGSLRSIKNDYPNEIYPYLISKFKNDEVKLVEIYHTANNKYKKEIIKCLIDLNVAYTIMSLKDSFPDITYPYLSQQFDGYDDKLMKISLDNPIAFFSAKESSYSLDEFLSENHHFLNFIAESPLLLKEVFIKSNDKMKLYLLLIYYGKSNLKFFPIAHFYNIGSDCYKENIKEFSSNFEGYMNKALEGFEKNDYILAYLIDREAFKNKLDYIKKTKIIVLDYDEKIKDIKNKYLQLKKKANSKQEIESLLKQESTEFDLIFDQKKVNILMSIMNSNKKLHSSKVLPKPLVSRVESKNKVNLETITIDHKLTNNYQSDRKKIDSELESIIINLNDANEIMKAKSQTKKEQNLLIDTKDFCFTLQTSNYQLANNDKIIKVLGEFLIRYEDMTIRKAILHFASRSTNKSWIKYLEQIMNIDKSGQFNEFYIYFLSRNKSSKNLKLLFMMLELKYKFPKIDNGIKDISGSFNIIENNSIIILEILLEHLLFLNYFANPDDIYYLNDFKNNIKKTFPTSQRKALLSLIDEIIEKAGKESKTISLNQEQRADSKDIFVNKD